MDKLQALVNLLKSLSWTKIGELSVLIVVLVLAMTFYENRQYVYESMGANSLSSHTPLIEVSEKSKQEIREMVERSPVILGIHVVDVNFIKNTRRTIFVNIDDVTLKKAFAAYLQTKIVDAPAVTTLEPDNQRLVRLVNGEFVCLPYKDTIGQIMIGGGDNVGHVCSMAVPPIYGKFRGYITAFVAKGVKPSELGQVKIVLQNLSINIYNGK